MRVLRPLGSGATVLVVLLLAVVLADPAAAHSGAQAYAPANGSGTGHAVRPHGIGLSGDSTLDATDLHWSRWGKRRAVATGTVRVNDCTPSCANGSWTTIRHERLVLSRPRSACGARYFTRVRLTGRFDWDLTYKPLWCREGA